jgi:hypothetical protein
MGIQIHPSFYVHPRGLAAMREMEMGERDALPGASQTRTEERPTRPGEPGKAAGKEKKGQALERRLNKVKEDIERALGIGSGGCGDDPTWQRVEEVLRGAVVDLGELQGLTGEESGEVKEKERMEEVIENAIAKGLRKAFAMRTGPPAPTTGGGRKPLWSEVASSNRPTVEVRLDSSYEGTSDEKLEKIRETIPDAQAIVPHARAKDKVSVVVPTTTRNTLLRNGLKEGTEGIKLIRRPILGMILGVPLTQPITSGKSVENNAWIKDFAERNKIVVRRVEWMYTQKMVEKMRNTRSQNRGSVIVEMATQDDRDRVVRDGVFIGAEWFRVTCWDVAMKEVQCFRCWRWGHTQSVCNAPEELCGYCAGKHPHHKCTTKEKEKASCAGCKEKGHFAFHRHACKGYRKFRLEKEQTRSRLTEMTARVCQGAKERPAMSSPPPPPPMAAGWSVVTARKVGEKSKRTSTGESDEEKNKQRRGPGRPRGSTAAARDRNQPQIRLLRKEQPTQSPAYSDAMESIETGSQ